MARLRDPKRGCPWDLEQDFASIVPYTLEEAYEVADAIQRGDAEDLCEELGDLLFQVVFHARLAAEQNLFRFADVVAAIEDSGTPLVRLSPGPCASGQYVETDDADAAQAMTEYLAALDHHAAHGHLAAIGGLPGEGHGPPGALGAGPGGGGRSAPSRPDDGRCRPGRPEVRLRHQKKNRVLGAQYRRTQGGALQSRSDVRVVAVGELPPKGAVFFCQECGDGSICRDERRGSPGTSADHLQGDMT